MNSPFGAHIMAPACKKSWAHLGCSQTIGIPCILAFPAGFLNRRAVCADKDSVSRCVQVFEGSEGSRSQINDNVNKARVLAGRPVDYCPSDCAPKYEVSFSPEASVISYSPYLIVRTAVPIMRTLVVLSFDSGSQKSSNF